MSPGNLSEVPHVEFSEADRRVPEGAAGKVAEAISQFREKGFVRLDKVFSEDTIAEWSAHYTRNYGHTLSSTRQSDKRPLYTVDVEGPFNREELYANPLAFPVVRSCLGEDCIVGAMSIIVSFPGAPAQRIHRDSQPLFGADQSIDSNLPPYAMTMLVPLVDCTVETGCTQVWPGTHRSEISDSDAAKVEPIDPEVPAGSVLFTDCRLIHRGGENFSNRHRPVVYLTYHRAWFRDYWGYDARPPVNIEDGELQKVPANYQHLFAWTKDKYRGYRFKNRVRKLLPSPLTDLARKINRDSSLVRERE